MAHDRDQPSVPDIVDIAGASIAARTNLEGCGPFQSFRAVSEYSSGSYSKSMFASGDLLLFNNLRASGMDVYIGTEKESVI